VRRRNFITLFGGAAAFPLAASAKPGRMPRVGFLMLGNPDPSVFLREVTTGLRELKNLDGD
jgi:putative tryptophan/tyrosine transport system substrate-binding protein